MQPGETQKENLAQGQKDAFFKRNVLTNSHVFEIAAKSKFSPRFARKNKMFAALRAKENYI
jgi:hypothetical protein